MGALRRSRPRAGGNPHIGGGRRAPCARPRPLAASRGAHRLNPQPELGAGGPPAPSRGRVSEDARSAPAAAHRAEAEERRTEKDETGRLRSGKQLSADFTTTEIHGVDVEISQ